MDHHRRRGRRIGCLRYRCNALARKTQSLFHATYGLWRQCDYVNAEKVQLTEKREEKHYWHTGHPGGIKSRTKDEILTGAYPERVAIAVKRMLPANRLSRKLMTNLRLCRWRPSSGGQSPEALDVKSMNPKNTGGRIMSEEIKSLGDLSRYRRIRSRCRNDCAS